LIEEFFLTNFKKNNQAYKKKLQHQISKENLETNPNPKPDPT
jgi:hypothetical protein